MTLNPFIHLQFSAGNYYFDARVINGVESADRDGNRAELEERNRKMQQIEQLLGPAERAFEEKLAVLDELNRRIDDPHADDTTKNKLGEEKEVLMPAVDQAEDDVIAVKEEMEVLKVIGSRKPASNCS